MELGDTLRKKKELTTEHKHTKPLHVEHVGVRYLNSTVNTDISSQNRRHILR